MPESRIKRHTVVQEAMMRIKEMITSGNFSIGDSIPTENQLAEKFGIGRSSIREAIKVFQYLGILETRVPKGTFICDSTNIVSNFITWIAFLESHYIDEILEMREIFEQKGINYLLSDSIDNPINVPEVVAELEVILSNMKKAVDENEIELLPDYDYAFHKVLIRCSQNNLMVSMFEQFSSFTKEEMRETHKIYDDYHKLVTLHQLIIDAIKLKDRESAFKFHSEHFPMIKEHLHTIKEGIK